MTRDWRQWAPDAGIGAAILFLGLVEAFSTDYSYGYDGTGRMPVILVALTMAAAVSLSRLLPGAALALIWAMGAIQLITGTRVLLVEFAVAIVAFGTARWGSTAVLWLSGLSVPAAAVVGVAFVTFDAVFPLLAGSRSRNVLDAAYSFGDTWQVGAVLIGMFALGAPWLAGLALRLGVRAQASKVSQAAAEADAERAVHETEQALEIARLREEQTRLARDVHDVVGHSLAVILAQAESAQFLADTDTQKLKKTMATIATSARSSLQDVRQVLTTTQGPAVHQGGLDSLVDGVRGSGHEVLSTEVGSPQPLPPELDVVAFRVLQEMLTNAIKHGRRDTPVSVERHWEGELRIEVRNAIEVAAGADLTQPIQVRPPEPGGQGLDGMRRRLESVGGRLDVRRREEAVGPTFTATAWVPVRAVAP
jgi:signal transduction histidine kinase